MLLPHAPEFCRYMNGRGYRGIENVLAGHCQDRSHQRVRRPSFACGKKSDGQLVRTKFLSTPGIGSNWNCQQVS